jgi:hypothetical protein
MNAFSRSSSIAPVYDSERNGPAELSTIEELSLELFQYRPLGKRDNTSPMKPEQDGG